MSRHRDPITTMPYMRCTFYQTFSMRMSNGKPELVDPWVDLRKLVSRREPKPTCGCTLSLGSRGEKSVLGGENETTHHRPMWPLIHAFSQIITCSHPFHD